VSYFQGVRLYAALESTVFCALLVVWIGELSEDAKLVLGWVHGFGWIALCLLVAWGYVRRIFPGPLLAATVSPAGPLGALIGFEFLVRRRRSGARVPGGVSAERAERAHAVPDPAGSGPGGRAAGHDPGR
jgi:uncharacterized membrane protein